MSSYNTIKYLVANKDYPLKAAGVAIDICDSGDCSDGCRYNAAPGEILIVDMDTRLTIDAAAIATTNRIGIAQAMGKNGCASDLKWLWHENFNLCQHKFDVKVDSPDCGKGQILDVWLSGCTGTDLTMGFGMYLDDSYVRSTMGYNNKLLYSWVVDNFKAGCKDCNATAVCDELICALVDKINGVYQSDPTKVTLGHGANMCQRYQPFRASRLYPLVANSIKNFTLAFEEAADCVECAYVPAITGITINGTPTAFTGTTDPSDSTRTLVSQLPRVIALMNAALKPIGGRAQKLSGLGKCCEYTIQTSSCATTIVLNSGQGTISPSSTSTPAVTEAAEVICRDCAQTPAPTPLTCGIRFYVDQLDVPCDCAWPPNLPLPNSFIRTLQPTLLGDGATNHHLVVQTIQAPVHPRGFGYYYQDMERRKSNGGPGGDFMLTNVHNGYLMQPQPESRDANIETICNEKYCVWDFQTIFSAIGNHNSALQYHQNDLARVIIRSANAQLIPDWEAILEALKLRGLCSNIETHCNVTFPEEES